MERLPSELEHGLANGFVLRGVRVHKRRDILRVCVPVHDQTGFADQFADAWTDHVNAQHRTPYFTDHLDCAATTKNGGLRVAGQIVFVRGDLVVTEHLFCFHLGVADRCDLRLTVGDLRNIHIWNEHGVQPRNLLRDEDALLVAAVRKLQTRNDVTDGVNTRDAGRKTLVRDHEAAVKLDADFLQANTFSVRATPDRDKEVLRIKLGAVGERDLHPGIGLFHAFEEHPEFQVNPALFICALKLLRHRLFFVGNEVVRTFNDGDLGTVGVPHTRKLAPDHPSAEDDDFLGDNVELQRLLTGDNAAADFEPGQRPGMRTGRQDDRFPADPIAVDLNCLRRDELALTLNDGDAVSLEQTLQTLELRRDDAVAERADGLNIDAVKLSLDTELRCVASFLRDFCGVEHCLRWHTPSMQAGAPQLVFLNDGGGLPELCRSDCRRVAGASAAKDNYIKLLICQQTTPSLCEFGLEMFRPSVWSRRRLTRYESTTTDSVARGGILQMATRRVASHIRLSLRYGFRRIEGMSDPLSYSVSDDLRHSVPRGLPLVVAIPGLTDAGSAVSGTAEFLDKHADPRPIVRFDEDLLLDYRARRPMISLKDGRFSEYEAETLALSLASDSLGTPFLILSGFEPDYRWNAFVDAVLRLIDEFDVAHTTILHAVPMPVPHTAPQRFTLTGTRDDLIQEHSAWHPSARIISSVTNLLELRIQQIDDDVVSWAALIPHYLSGNAYPVAVAGLVSAISTSAGLLFDPSELNAAAQEFRDAVDQQLQRDEEGLALVRELEARYQRYQMGEEAREELLGEDGEIPSAEELASEFERFLADSTKSDLADTDDESPPGELSDESG